MASKNEDIFYLRKCIDSILCQTFKNFVLYIVIEENDYNFQYFKKLTFNNDNIKLLINNKKPGVAVARNMGIQNSQSKYIAISDSDDFYDLNKFKKQITFLEKKKNISLVGTNLFLVDGKDNIVGQRLYPQNPNEIKKQFLYKMPVANPSIVVRRDDINEVGLFDDNFKKAEDFELWLRFLTKNKKMYNIQENLVYYRTTRDANQKRGSRHYKNYYIAFKRHSKFIWPFGVRLISLLMFFVIQLIPNWSLSILLNTKIVNKIKGVKTDIRKLTL